MTFKQLNYFEYIPFEEDGQYIYIEYKRFLSDLDKKQKAIANWSIFKGYFLLSHIFYKTKKEQNRNPNIDEFIGFFQFPKNNFNWRKISNEQQQLIDNWKKNIYFHIHYNRTLNMINGTIENNDLYAIIYVLF